jgi:protein phosphatase
VGCVRENNEDMILVGDTFVRNGEYATGVHLTDKMRYLIALCDGMGGHNSGEVASSDSLENLHFFFNDIPSGLDASGFYEDIVEWLESINNIIDSKGHVVPECKGMGTTLVAIAYFEGKLYSMNCGDSRMYRYRQGKLEQQTTDHSLNNMMGSSEHNGIITNCIGGGCKNSFIDMVCCTPDVLPGDTFLLCSDGLTDMVPDDQIETMLAGDADASALCQRAEDLGGLDNVSAVVVRVGH